MLRHLLKITFRNLARTKLYSFINILGLSLGIGCAVLIILFVKDELTFDNFHSAKEELYRVFNTAERRDGSENTNTVVPMITGPTLAENYPEIEATTVWYSYSDQVTYEDESYEETINMASTSFFDMFDFTVEQGSLDGALDEPYNIVITEEVARKYFGDEIALGQNLLIPIGPEQQPFEVKAVLENIPSNSSLQFDFLLSEKVGEKILPENMLTSWHFVSAETYVKLHKGASAEDLEAKFPELIQTIRGEELNGRKYELGLQPLLDVHLDSDMPQGIAPVSDPKYTLILSTIAILILIMACINFMNLSLGRSLTRAREIGIKKVVGAFRGQLVFQFLGESIFLSLLSLGIGLGLAYLGLPLFNELSGKELLFDIGMLNVFIFIGLTLVVGILAGVYPALVMSGFKPVSILKGKLSIGGSGNGLRITMITFQLILSIFMITSALFMKSQLNFISNKNLGFNQDQLVVLPMTANERGLRQTITVGYEKAERGLPQIEGLPAVSKVGISTHNFEPGWMDISYTDTEDTRHSFNMNVIDANYFDLLEMKIVEGRGFSKENEADRRRSIVVNQAFVKEFGLENPVGDRIPHDQFPDHEIIGVVEDFHFSSLHNKITPLVLTMNAEIGFEGASGLSLYASFVPKLIVKLNAGEIAAGIEQIQGKWEEIYPGDPLNYSFVDETIQSQYEQEANLDTTITFATALSVIIGLLGLFGLSTLTMNARLKEMSIRKVLGAMEGSIIFSLSKTYLGLVLLATLLSVPITYYFINNWLEGFEYRISIGFVQFAAGCLIVLIAAFLTLSYQSIKIAFANPIDALKSE